MTRTRKTAGKIRNNNIISKSGMKDIPKLKRIARRMLEQLEEAIEECGTVPKKNSNDNNRSGKDILFSGKTSLIAALITLTDLLLKLESTGPQGEEINKEDELEKLPLSKADRELLKQFVEKQRSKPTS